MKYNGSYLFKKIINNRGFYGEIELEVRLVKNDLYIAQIDLNYDKEKEWEIALLYGANLFLKRGLKSAKYNLDITVKEWNWLPQDTTLPVASFVMFKALENALGITTDDYSFNEQISAFIIKPY